MLDESDTAVKTNGSHIEFSNTISSYMKTRWPLSDYTASALANYVLIVSC